MTNQKTEIPSLKWSQVSARRLERNGLSTANPAAQPAGITRAMCGAHAQIMSAAELSIGLRMAGGTQAAIRAALWEDHSLVKTYGPRGTVHLLPTQDLPMWCGALSATPYGQTRDPRQELLTPEQHEAVIAAIAEVLADAELTTDELTEALVERLGAWAGDPVMQAFQGNWPRWRMAQSTAGVRGALCFGLNRGNKVTFTSPRRWLPGFQPLDERAALSGLLRNYLFSYGPATPEQFARWLAVPKTWADRLFDLHSAELQQVELEGTPAWLAAGDTAMPPEEPRGVRLLPYFDTYTISSHPRELVFPGRAGERALNRGQAGNYPVLLINGTVAGIWHLRRSGKKIDITVEAFETLTPAQRGELDHGVARIGEILEGRAQWTAGVVTSGPHA